MIAKSYRFDPEVEAVIVTDRCDGWHEDIDELEPPRPSSAEGSWNPCVRTDFGTHVECGIMLGSGKDRLPACRANLMSLKSFSLVFRDLLLQSSRVPVPTPDERRTGAGVQICATSSIRYRGSQGRRRPIHWGSSPIQR